MTFEEYWMDCNHDPNHYAEISVAFKAGAASRDAEIETLRELKQAWHDKFWESDRQLASRDAEVATLRELKQAWHDKFWESEKKHNQLREQVKMLQINLKSASNYIDSLGGNSKDYRQALAATEPKP